MSGDVIFCCRTLAYLQTVQAQLANSSNVGTGLRPTEVHLPSGCIQETDANYKGDLVGGVISNTMDGDACCQLCRYPCIPCALSDQSIRCSASGFAVAARLTLQLWNFLGRVVYIGFDQQRKGWGSVLPAVQTYILAGSESVKERCFSQRFGPCAPHVVLRDAASSQAGEIIGAEAKDRAAIDMGSSILLSSADVVCKAEARLSRACLRTFAA